MRFEHPRSRATQDARRALGEIQPQHEREQVERQHTVGAELRQVLDVQSRMRTELGIERSKVEPVAVAVQSALDVLPDEQRGVLVKLDADHAAAPASVA